MSDTNKIIFDRDVDVADVKNDIDDELGLGSGERAFKIASAIKGFWRENGGAEKSRKEVRDALIYLLLSEENKMREISEDVDNEENKRDDENFDIQDDSRSKGNENMEENFFRYDTIASHPLLAEYADLFAYAGENIDKRLSFLKSLQILENNFDGKTLKRLISNIDNECYANKGILDLTQYDKTFLIMGDFEEKYGKGIFIPFYKYLIENEEEKGSFNEFPPLEMLAKIVTEYQSWFAGEFNIDALDQKIEDATKESEQGKIDFNKTKEIVGDVFNGDEKYTKAENLFNLDKGTDPFFFFFVRFLDSNAYENAGKDIGKFTPKELLGRIALFADNEIAEKEAKENIQK